MYSYEKVLHFGKEDNNEIRDTAQELYTEIFTLMNTALKQKKNKKDKITVYYKFNETNQEDAARYLSNIVIFLRCINAFVMKCLSNQSNAKIKICGDVKLSFSLDYSNVFDYSPVTVYFYPESGYSIGKQVGSISVKVKNLVGALDVHLTGGLLGMLVFASGWQNVVERDDWQWNTSEIVGRREDWELKSIASKLDDIVGLPSGSIKGNWGYSYRYTLIQCCTMLAAVWNWEW